jgi:hypothetical protein
MGLPGAELVGARWGWWGWVRRAMGLTSRAQDVYSLTAYSARSKLQERRSLPVGLGCEGVRV